MKTLVKPDKFENAGFSLACEARRTWFKYFERECTKQRSREELPAWMIRTFCFDNPMTSFENRINTGNQSVDRNKKHPANLARKSYCDTVESDQNKTIRCGVSRWRRRKNREKCKR